MSFNPRTVEEPVVYRLHSLDDGSEFALENQQVLVGSAPDSDILLLDLDPRHARFMMINGQLFLEDSQSSTGTFVNNQLVTRPARLEINDEIQLGERLFRLESIAEALDAEPLDAESLEADGIASDDADMQHFGFGGDLRDAPSEHNFELHFTESDDDPLPFAQRRRQPKRGWQRAAVVTVSCLVVAAVIAVVYALLR